VRLVFTVLDANKIWEDRAVGSTYKRLSKLIPQAGLNYRQWLNGLKGKALEFVRKGSIDALDNTSIIKLGANSWQGELQLTSKPRKALFGNFFASPVQQGSVNVRLRYLPIPQVPIPHQKYRIMSDTPGIDYVSLCKKYKERRRLEKQQQQPSSSVLDIDDLEHCFHISHEKTGATCCVYRSLETKLIVVAFRGTCVLIDLVTDVTIAQRAWVEGEDVRNQLVAKVHAGFRSSLDSISRRLKDLVLATVGPGEKISDYDMLVTGHSLGKSGILLRRPPHM